MKSGEEWVKSEQKLFTTPNALFIGIYKGKVKSEEFLALRRNKKYKGIAPHCYLLPIKVLDKSGHGRSESIINASDWIIRNKNKYNIRIVNISIGTKSSSCSEEKSDIVKAVDNMWDNGITVLVSAGNNGPSYQSITIPGISRKVITVGSCKFDNSSYDGHFKYSGKGPTFCNVAKPDIVVPGDNITSCSPGNRYVKKSGTSMSTPIVAGAAALIFSYDNTLSNIILRNY